VDGLASDTESVADLFPRGTTIVGRNDETGDDVLERPDDSLELGGDGQKVLRVNDVPTAGWHPCSLASAMTARGRLADIATR
jgi:hypothetical protein